MKRSQNGVRSIAPPGGTTCSFTWLSNCTSASLRRSTAAANGVAVDRAAQLRPQPGDGADVVLMRMGDDQAHQLVAPIGDEAGIGHHHIDLGVLRAAEADAAIHRQPSARRSGRG